MSAGKGALIASGYPDPRRIVSLGRGFLWPAASSSGADDGFSGQTLEAVLRRIIAQAERTEETYDVN